MKPFFSIIIPTYNRAQMIGSAIESMLQQTYLSWELVIVDDGSSDNTAEVIAGYVDERVKYFYQKNAERCLLGNQQV
jgi:glycosyltransferase involved in cell wall biosynthesis